MSYFLVRKVGKGTRKGIENNYPSYSSSPVIMTNVFIMEYQLSLKAGFWSRIMWKARAKAMMKINKITMISRKVARMVTNMTM